MGASYNSNVFTDKSRSEIEKEWGKLVENDLVESGNSYSGGIGMLGKSIEWTVKHFDNYNAADDYIADNHEKWSPPLAVSYTEKDKKYWLIGGWCSS
jgi:hypothetical protein